MTFTRNSWLSVWSIVGYVCHVKKSVAICTDDDGYAYGVMRVLCGRCGLRCERLGMPACAAAPASLISVQRDAQLRLLPRLGCAGG